MEGFLSEALIRSSQREVKGLQFRGAARLDPARWRAVTVLVGGSSEGCAGMEGSGVSGAPDRGGGALAQAHPFQCREHVPRTQGWAADCAATSRAAPRTCSCRVVLASPNHSPPGKQFSEDRG